ncbi:hypothetical protein ACOME3_007806 [Neoechinorhynchus agilis]
MQDNVPTTSPRDLRCLLCDDNITIGSYGACNHIICYTCSTKLRVICKNWSCPICRHDLNEVVFAKSFNIKFDEIKSKTSQKDEHGICFEDKACEKAMHDLNRIKCSQCADSQTQFSTMEELDSHLNICHRLQFCKICLDFVKLFPFERKVYTRDQLVKHMVEGEKDDTSFSGHPMCRYCELRFFDKDELFRHSTTNHYYCSFCSAEGDIVFWSDYQDLKKHFRFNHYLCELGECGELRGYSNVFRTEAEYKAHVVQNHARGRRAIREAGILTDHNLFTPSHRQPNRSESESLPPTQRQSSSVPTFDGTDSSAFPELVSGTTPRLSLGTCEWGRNQPTKVTTNIDSEFPQLAHIELSSISISVSVPRYPQQKVPNISRDFPALPESNQPLFDRLAPRHPKPLLKLPRLPVSEKQSLSKSVKQTRPPTNQVDSFSSNLTTAAQKTQKTEQKPFQGSLEEDFPALLTKSTNVKRKVRKDHASKAEFPIDLATQVKNSLFVSSSIPITLDEAKRSPVSPTDLAPEPKEFPILAGTIPDASDSNTWINEGFYVKHKIQEGDNRRRELRRLENEQRRKQQVNFPPPPPGLEHVKPKYHPQHEDPFIKPPDYDRRNALLVCKIKDRLDGENSKFAEFRQVYSDYVKYTADALTFYNKCVELFRIEPFAQLVWDIIALIPNIYKQNEFHSVIQTMLLPSLNVTERRKLFMQSNKSGMGCPLVKCQTCEQLVFMDAVRAHQACHS